MEISGNTAVAATAEALDAELLKDTNAKMTIWSVLYEKLVILRYKGNHEWSGEAFNTGYASMFKIESACLFVNQGRITEIGGGGDMTIDTTAIIAGQQIDVTLFLAAGSA